MAAIVDTYDHCATSKRDMNVDNYATSTQAHNEISCHREHYEIRSCEKHLTRDWRCCVRRERVQFISVTWEEHEEKKNSEKLEEKIRRPCLIAEFFQTFKQTVRCIFSSLRNSRFSFIQSTATFIIAQWPKIRETRRHIPSQYMI